MTIGTQDIGELSDEDRHPVLRLARTDGFAALAWRAASIIREG